MKSHDYCSFQRFYKKNILKFRFYSSLDFSISIKKGKANRLCRTLTLYAVCRQARVNREMDSHKNTSVPPIAVSTIIKLGRTGWLSAKMQQATREQHTMNCTALLPLNSCCDAKSSLTLEESRAREGWESLPTPHLSAGHH